MTGAYAIVHKVFILLSRDEDDYNLTPADYIHLFSISFLWATDAG